VLFRSMCFLVHEISPTTDVLTLNQTRCSDIGNLPKRHFSDTCKYNRRQYSSDQSPMNGDSTFPNSKRSPPWTIRITLPLKHDIIDPCKNDGNRNGKYN